MKNTLRIISVLIICAMLVPMALTSFANVGSLDSNWTSMACKYSKGTWKIIAPKSNSYEIKTEGFDFAPTADGAIKVVTPDYATFKGSYGVSAVSSSYTTPLDGLSVFITPDEFDNMQDNTGRGNTLGVLWSEEKIETIAGKNEAGTGYDKGLSTAVLCSANGLRNLIPTVPDVFMRYPASSSVANGNTNGQALYVGVTCSIENDVPTMNTVNVVYYDGYYVNDDSNPGYRWSFTARNMEDTPNSDATNISRGFEYIDISKGLNINVRADETLGFIVNVNGYDFYKGEEVGYFPDCNTEGYGYNLNSMDNEKIHNLDEIYTTSMTYAKADIDLNGLKTAGNGYVTVGAVSNNDEYLEGHHCNYTIQTINGVPAANWKGEEMSDSHVCTNEFAFTKAASCTRFGGDFYICQDCGKFTVENKLEATGHVPEVDVTHLEDPSCNRYGTAARLCAVCDVWVEVISTDPIPHTFADEWTILEEAGCENEGKRVNHCTVCAEDIEESIPALGHIYEWVVVTPATCGSDGSETETCKGCGKTGETRVIPADENAHVAEDAWTPVVVDGAWDGKETNSCAQCGAAMERTVEVFDYIKHFTDVKSNQWYVDEVAYCVQKGYINGMSDTTFVPNGNLTRAQFLTLLAQVDGVDLTQYETTDTGFADVKPAHWYNEVVAWALDNELTSGLSETKFGPNEPITRSQLARFFKLYTEKKGFDVSAAADLSEFTDADKVQGWAKDSVEWAVSVGLISGVGENKLSPNSTASRAQAARMIMVYTQLEFTTVE